MNFKNYVPFFIVILFSVFGLADQNRINFLNKEIKFLESMVSKGQANAKMKQSLSNYKAELKKLSGVTTTKKAKSRKYTRSKTTVKSNSNDLQDVAKRVVKARARLSVIMSDLANRPPTDRGRGPLLREKNRIENLLAYIERSGAQSRTIGSESYGTKSSNTNSLMGDLKVSGNLKIRTEFKNRTGYQGSNVDARTAYRFRPQMDIKRSDYHIRFSPQLTKNFGGDENRAGAGNTTSTVETSGQVNQPGLDVYEAFINYKISDQFEFLMGREALAYGDQLIIGSLDWAIPGRSFNLVKFRYNTGPYKYDAFFSKLSDNLTANEKSDDANLAGLYLSRKKQGQLFKEFDFYVLNLNSKKATNALGIIEVSTFGFRFKGAQNQIFYRLEAGLQNGKNVGDEAHQVDAEVGYNFGNFKTTFNYINSGKNYRQLFPTAHKFLGFADILGRRNVTDYSLRLWHKWDKLVSKLHVHSFQRTSDSDPVYTLGGTGAYGVPGDGSKDVGLEVDLILTYNFKKHTGLQLGLTQFSPGKYFKNQAVADAGKAVNFYYLQLVTKF